MQHMTRQNSSAKKAQLKDWLLEHPEAMRAWRDAPDDLTSRRLLVDLVRQAGIYSAKTSRSDVPIGGAILELLETTSEARLFGDDADFSS
jgi:hypothetical protein